MHTRRTQCFSTAGLRVYLKKISRTFPSNSLALARQALQLQLTRAKTFNRVFLSGERDSQATSDCAYIRTQGV